PLPSSRTSRPSLRGRLRSSRMRCGCGASVYSPSRRRKRSASTPSETTCSRLPTLCSSNASLVMRTSPGSSSTSSSSMGCTKVTSLNVSDLFGFVGSRPSGAALVLGRAPAAGALLGTVRRGADGGRSPCRGRGAVPGGDRRVGLGAPVVGRGGQGPAYAGAGLLGLGVQPDPAAVELHDLLAHRQSDAGAAVLVPGAQPLEDDEDPLGVLRVDADAVVGAAEDPLVALAPGADVHPGVALAAELDRVAHQVEEDLGEQGAVALDGGQVLAGDHRAGLVQPGLQA